MGSFFWADASSNEPPPDYVDLEPIRHVETVSYLGFLGPVPCNIGVLKGLISVAFQMDAENIDLEIFQPCKRLESLEFTATDKVSAQYECSKIKGLGSLCSLKRFKFEHRRLYSGVRIVVEKGLRNLELFHLRCRGRILFRGETGGFDQLFERVKRFMAEYYEYTRGEKAVSGIHKVLDAAKGQGIGLMISGGKLGDTWGHTHPKLGNGMLVRYSYFG